MAHSNISGHSRRSRRESVRIDPKEFDSFEMAESLQAPIKNLLDQVSQGGSVLVGAMQSPERMQAFDAMNLLIVARNRLLIGESTEAVFRWLREKAQEGGVFDILVQQNVLKRG